MKTDREIKQLVIDALNGQPYLNSTEICVSVKNGIVKLTGFVESDCARVAVQNVITNGVGVKSISDNMHLNFTELMNTETGEKQRQHSTYHTLTKKSNRKVV
jgi:hypothetical protein